MNDILFDTGVYTVHLERTDSENYYMIGSNGIVNRWIPQQSHLLNPSDIKLSHFNSTLIIPADGLYNIYAQVVANTFPIYPDRMLIFLFFHQALLRKSDSKQQF